MKILKNVMVIPLSKQELKTGLDRLQHAENLIRQLNYNHSGRNKWLIKYGESAEAIKLRKESRNENKRK